ncbi:MAG: hypothetical protein IPN53_19665 [Comamonadaceae bacterium]|nr:hypothetical protein [Comamonadaceae bacterium]
MIALILDTFIPAEQELGMPSASAIDFDGYANRYGVQDLVSRYAALVDAVAFEKLTQPFSTLSEGERLNVINATRAKDIRLFSGFITHVFRAYYSAAEVLTLVGGGAVPPFPDGNVLENDDWTQLEPVYERGPIYRAVEEPTA